MQKTIKIGFILTFLWHGLLGFAQQHSLERLELFYTQKHYKKTYRLAGKLLNNPDFDHFSEPLFFRASSALQLALQTKNTNKKQQNIEEILQLYEDFHAKFDENERNKSFYEQYIRELAQQLAVFTQETTERNSNYDTKALHELSSRYFSSYLSTKEPINTNKSKEKGGKNTFREQLISFAMEQLNSPYTYGGNSPNGFDCSGFVTYVFNAYQINLPRISREQYDKAIKIKKNDVQKGDLIFFDSGKGINHVGIIVSEEGEKLKMIHASTTQGVVITVIEDSSYWNKRIKGYGTYINSY